MMTCSSTLRDSAKQSRWRSRCTPPRPPPPSPLFCTVSQSVAARHHRQIHLNYLTAFHLLSLDWHLLRSPSRDRLEPPSLDLVHFRFLSLCRFFLHLCLAPIIRVMNASRPAPRTLQFLFRNAAIFGIMPSLSARKTRNFLQILVSSLHLVDSLLFFFTLVQPLGRGG